MTSAWETFKHPTCYFCNKPIPPYWVSGKYSHLIGPQTFADADCYQARIHDTQEATEGSTEAQAVQGMMSLEVSE